MKSQPSKKTWALLGAIYIGLVIAAGFWSGAAGLNETEAFLVIAALLLISLPVLVFLVRDSIARRRQR